MQDTLFKNEMKNLKRNLGKPGIVEKRRMLDRKRRKGHPYLDKKSIMGSTGNLNPTPHNGFGFNRKRSSPSFPHGTLQGSGTDFNTLNRASMERISKGFSIRGMEVENTVRRNRRGGYRQPPLPQK